MQPRRAPGIIRPKVSTMPRNKTEASCQLELYKLITEKQRLNQELELVQQRTQQINQRLSVLNTQIGSTEKTIQEMRGIVPEVSTDITVTNDKKTFPKTNNLSTFYLEY